MQPVETGGAVVSMVEAGVTGSSPGAVPAIALCTASLEAAAEWLSELAGHKQVYLLQPGVFDAQRARALYKAAFLNAIVTL